MTRVYPVASGDAGVPKSKFRAYGAGGTGTRAGDDGIGPHRAVARGRAGRQNRQDELDILPGQGAEIQICAEDQAIIFLAQAPKRVDRTASDLIVQPERHVAARGVVGATDDRSEPVAALDAKGRESSVDVAVVGSSAASGSVRLSVRKGAILQLGIVRP